MVNAAHGAQDSLTLAKNIPCDTETRFPINRPRRSVAFRGVRIRANCKSIVQVTSTRHERANKEPAQELTGRGIRKIAGIDSALVAAGTGGSERRNSVGLTYAVAGVEQRGLGRIPT